MAAGVVGIDPGINGALCFFDAPLGNPGASIIDVLDVPTTGDGSKRRLNPTPIWRWLDKHQPQHVFLELVSAMPSIAHEEGDTRRSMGAASAFRFGDVVGSLRTTVICCGLPFTLVVAPRWKKHHGLHGSDKEASRQKAIDLLPAHAGLFARVKDNNRAEACLIAMYGWHELRKGT